MENSTMLVQALYSFTGKNNDELCFKRGDVITVTQPEEGGWWEGTLDDKTGWFPSNYVKDYKTDGSSGTKSPSRSEGAGVDPLPSPQQVQQQKVYRNMILKDILDSERNHVSELQVLMNSYLIPLHKSDALSEAEYKQMVSNLEDVLSAHQRLVDAIQEQCDRPASEQRIGGVFLTMAPSLQSTHKLYCSTHPKAVCILEKYKDELNSFMECSGAQRPGIMVLTTALSKPFRHLDKYSGMLQEYLRHLEEGHPDRGDTQRSSHVYRDFATLCSSVRRQKELELEVVTGSVHGWDGGETLGVLGDVVHMGSVALLPDHRDHYLVLFPSVLVKLAVSPRMSAFIFEGKYQLSSIHVNQLEDCDSHKNAFEITAPKADRIIAVCQTSEDQQKWVDILRQQIRTAKMSNFNPHKPLTLSSPPIPPAHNASRVHRQNSSTAHSGGGRGKVWSMSCLRPSPPLRPGLSTRDERRNQRNKKKEDKWHEEDTLILRVIESYCTSAKTRYTVNSTLLDNPQVLLPEEEKIIVEETRGNQVIIEEKSLVDTVYAIKDQLAVLLKDHKNLRTEFDAEKLATQHLRSILGHHVRCDREDIRPATDI